MVKKFRCTLCSKPIRREGLCLRCSIGLRRWSNDLKKDLQREKNARKWS